MRLWNSGPPPSVGWWPTTRSGNSTQIRWWNGKHWSLPAPPYADGHTAGRLAGVRTSNHNRTICWRPRPASWPARSMT